MLLSSESKGRAVIQDCDPETPAKEKGIPQTSVFLISTGHCNMLLFTVLFSFFCPSAEENPAGSVNVTFKTSNTHSYLT